MHQNNEFVVIDFHSLIDCEQSTFTAFQLFFNFNSVYNNENNGIWIPNGLGSTPDQTFTALIPSHLTGTLLCQHKSANGTPAWEPYVLFYQIPNYTIGEIVLWAASDVLQVLLCGE